MFYYDVLSMVTPPVAISAYAAADISGANAMKIGFTATRKGLVAFIVPFVFIFEPSMLMQGSWQMILLRFMITCLGVVALAAALTG